MLLCLDFFSESFSNSNSLLHYGRKHSEWIYSRQAGEIQVKTMTQAFHLEADNIPVTFPGKCQGLDRSLGWQATKHGKQERGSPLHSLPMPKNVTV